MKQLGLVVAALLLAGGCGGRAVVEGRPPVYPASVTVLYNGQPVADATVMLRPKAGNKPAYGRTDAEGFTELTTFEQGDGAMAGEHQVRVRKVEVKVGPAPTPEEPDRVDILSETYLVPQRYDDVETSGLTVTVDSDADNAFTLQLTD